MAMKQETKDNLYKQVTEGLIAQMEQGIAIWQKPWVTSRANQPHNGESGRLYNGFNRMYLGYLQDMLGSTDPRWYTYKGAKAMDAQVRKGEKHTIVVFHAPSVDDRDPDNVKTFWMMRFYKVFHATQIDGLPEFDIEADLPEQPDADEDYDMHILTSWCMDNLNSIEHGSDRACYIPSLDAIQMPHEDTFHRKSWYVQTLAHEIIHATGAEKRLDRLERTAFGTDSYAKEELVAEFGAAMLCGSLDIPADMEQSAAYLKSWAKRCKDEPSLLVSAANMAEKAVDFITEDMYATA